MPLFGPCVARQREGRCALKTTNVFLATIVREIESERPGERKFSVYLGEKYGWCEFYRFEMSDHGRHYFMERTMPDGERLAINLYQVGVV